MTDTLNTGYEAFKGEIWSQKINAGLDKTCVMLQCVNRDYQADADKGTAKINIITPLSVTTGTYTGSIDSYGTAPNKKSQLELNQSVYFGFSVPDIDQAQSNVNIMDAIVGKAKNAVEQAIDAYIFGLNSAVPEANTIGQNTAVELTKENIYSNFVKLAKHLKTSGAITAENKGWVVIHPDVEELLLMCSEFTSAANLGDKTLSSGSIGKIAGLDVFVSSNVGKNTDGYTILAGTKQAITYASQIKKIETLRAQSSFDSIVRGLYTFGALAINPDALAVIKATIA
ncbi:MAG: hypothetical protein OSJ27_10095 [Candidatus Gastranaerophilales bacterium]|nr:hypothetical protein [Candidatus Gastranaerophilales bacterium]